MENIRNIIFHNKMRPISFIYLFGKDRFFPNILITVMHPSFYYYSFFSIFLVSILIDDTNYG